MGLILLVEKLLEVLSLHQLPIRLFVMDMESKMFELRDMWTWLWEDEVKYFSGEYTKWFWLVKLTHAHGENPTLTYLFSGSQSPTQVTVFGYSSSWHWLRLKIFFVNHVTHYLWVINYDSPFSISNWINRMSNFLWHCCLVQLAVRRTYHHIQSKMKKYFF